MKDYWNDISGSFEQAELLEIDDETLSIEIKNGRLKEITSGKVSAASLRVVHKGRLGSNFTMGVSGKNSGRLITGARQSAEFGPEATFGFSSAQKKEGDLAAGAGGKELLDYAAGMLDYMGKQEGSPPLNIYLGRHGKKLALRTSRGGECAGYSNIYALDFSAPVSGGSSEIRRTVYSKDFFGSLPEEECEEFLADYRSSTVVSAPKTGKMPVLFSPRALFFFVFCLQEGVSGRNLHLKISPLAGKTGAKIFSDKISVRDEPGRDSSPFARGFDDEGIITGDRSVVREGVLKSYIYDLNYGAASGAGSTGNGLKSSLFSEGAGTPVAPAFINPVIPAGGDSRDGIQKSLNEALIVESVMGFHSSNYTQGHFSVQAHGFHLKGGKVKGRLEDVMIAGNIYEDFQNVRAVGDRLYRASFGYAPWVLVDGISVSGG